MHSSQKNKKHSRNIETKNLIKTTHQHNMEKIDKIRPKSIVKAKNHKPSFIKENTLYHFKISVVFIKLYQIENGKLPKSKIKTNCGVA